jgi:hypothetical protein
MVVTGLPWVVAVAEVPELDCRMVLFARDSEDPFGTLEVQAAYTYDDRDRELGTDTYCVVVDGGDPVYGGITRWEASAEEVRIDLDPRAAELLRVPGQLRMPVAFDADELARLRDALRDMVGAEG